MATALDLIKGALRRINSYQTGEALASEDANDALETLNELLDSWSTSESYVYGSIENVFTFIPGQYIYTIGPGGNFDTPRPLRVTNAYTRITTASSSLDYPIDIISQDRYAEIGYKAIPAPWPVVLWYNPTMPLGTLYFYQSPSTAGELHLFTDTILSNLTLAQTIVLPQGYARAIKWNLAKELCEEFGRPLTETVKQNARESLAMIKALNAIPVPVAKYDSAIVREQAVDAGFFLNGGFR